VSPDAHSMHQTQSRERNTSHENRGRQNQYRYGHDTPLNSTRCHYSIILPAGGEYYMRSENSYRKPAADNSFVSTISKTSQLLLPQSVSSL